MGDDRRGAPADAWDPHRVPAGATPEEVLDDDAIQGNGLSGFNKDHQALVYLLITDVAELRSLVTAGRR